MTGVYCHIDDFGGGKVRVRVTRLTETFGVDAKGRACVVARENGAEVLRFEYQSKARGAALRREVEARVARELVEETEG